MSENFKYKVLGQKIKPRNSILDYRTKEIIDDGQNSVIILTQSNDSWSANLFLDSMKSNISDQEWKFWIEENKNE